MAGAALEICPVLAARARGGGNTTHLPRRGISFTADLHLQWVSTTRVQI